MRLEDEASVGYRVRRGEPRDLQALTALALANRVRHREIGAAKEETIAELGVRYASYLGGQESRHAAIAETLSDGKIVGMAVAVLWEGPRGIIANINDTYVAAPHRRRGLCRRLVATLAEVFAAHEVDEVTLQWWIDNPGAAAAWKSLGFVPETIQARVGLGRLRGDGERGG